LEEGSVNQKKKKLASTGGSRREADEDRSNADEKNAEHPIKNLLPARNGTMGLINLPDEDQPSHEKGRNSPGEPLIVPRPETDGAGAREVRPSGVIEGAGREGKGRVSPAMRLRVVGLRVCRAKGDAVAAAEE
jgi:hypothetical protein